MGTAGPGLTGIPHFGALYDHCHASIQRMQMCLSVARLWNAEPSEVCWITAPLENPTKMLSLYLWTQVGQVILYSNYDMLREQVINRISKWIFNYHLGTN